LTPVETAFIQKVRSDLAEYGMRLILRNSKFVQTEGVKCLGFFDQQNIIVATGTPNWVGTLAHEYSHFIQWATGSKIYSKCFGPVNNYADIQEEWLQGKKHKPFLVRRAFDAVREMERECEMIAVEVIKKYSLPIDIERYTQEANCYIYMHHLMENHRVHMDEFRRDPLNRRYTRMMPSTFRHKSHRKIPADIQAILEKAL
jgi:hypothetical protein